MVGVSLGLIGGAMVNPLQGTMSTYWLAQLHSITRYLFTQYEQVRDYSQPTMCVFGLGKKLGVPRGNPLKGRTGLNPQPLRCKVNMLTAEPLNHDYGV